MAGKKMVPGRQRMALVTGTAAIAALLLMASGYLWLTGTGTGTGQGVRPRASVIGGPFALVQGDGRSVTDLDFRGKYLLIYFGYTACRDVCPATLTNVAAALDMLGGMTDAKARAARLQALFITVDPARDTPAVLQLYTAAITPRLLGLTGTPAAIRDVTDEYRVSTIAHARSGPGDYIVDHSSVLYLVGPNGRYVAPIRADESAGGIAQAIARHLL